MKASRYNMIWELDGDKKIAFNSYTCALAEVNSDFIDVLNNIENIKYDEVDPDVKELVDNMLLGNYIVYDFIDELKLVKYRHLKGRFENDSLELVIAPTLSCNFECPYCYEDKKSGLMNQEVIDGIIQMVTQVASCKKNIHITWYGGEPLLAKEIIFKLSKDLIDICDKYGVDYTAFMVTNGYLLTEEIAGKLHESKIDGVQITIDGPPDIHNKRRKLKGSKEDTFYRILDNVAMLISRGIRVGIRINVDKTNRERIDELLDIFEEKQIKNVLITLGHVTCYTNACISVADSCLNTEEYAEATVKYNALLKKRGFNTEKQDLYPYIKTTYCSADSLSSYVVDPQGFMYKCWNDVGCKERAVGDIKKPDEYPGDNMYMRNVNYLLWSPFDHEECIECNMLPICMGGCPFNGEKLGDKAECDQWKYNLEKVVKQKYLYSADRCKEDCDACKSR